MIGPSPEDPPDLGTWAASSPNQGRKDNMDQGTLEAVREVHYYDPILIRSVLDLSLIYNTVFRPFMKYISKKHGICACDYKMN